MTTFDPLHRMPRKGKNASAHVAAERSAQVPALHEGGQGISERPMRHIRSLH